MSIIFSLQLNYKFSHLVSFNYTLMSILEDFKCLIYKINNVVKPHANSYIRHI